MDYDKTKFIQLSGDLFKAVQESHIFNDSKTFVDSIPTKNSEIIKEEFNFRKSKAGFDLKSFVYKNFFLPRDDNPDIIIPKGNMSEHIIMLWDLLIRKPNDKISAYSTLIPLPEEYVVPGGRFREVYYWDSYFTMLGLYTAGRYDLIIKMVNNFSWLIDKFGFIPNGNRVYYLSRSQPPFFPLMINLLNKIDSGEQINVGYLHQVEKEYQFWMRPEAKLIGLETGKHVVIIPGNIILNRYFDIENIPREESYFEDSELNKKHVTKIKTLMSDVRAAAESGWDFSGRWFEDGQNLSSIQTTNIVPIDLNCLLGYCELLLSDLYLRSDIVDKSKYYKDKFEQRLKFINDIFWDEEKGLFFDYNLRLNQRNPYYSLATVFPLFFGFADKTRAEKVAGNLEKLFLKDGGVITSLNTTKQQWDAPNGWPPLQWITIIGLRNYGFNKLADTVKQRWLKLNDSVYRETGRMFEKYNVENIHLPGGGGEYPLQDGFGWTNGIASALINNKDFEFTTRPV